jgi:hypothetical protein
MQTCRVLCRFPWRRREFGSGVGMEKHRRGASSVEPVGWNLRKESGEGKARNNGCTAWHQCNVGLGFEHWTLLAINSNVP